MSQSGISQLDLPGTAPGSECRLFYLGYDGRVVGRIDSISSMADTLLQPAVMEIVRLPDQPVLEAGVQQPITKCAPHYFVRCGAWQRLNNFNMLYFEQGIQVSPQLRVHLAL